MSTPAACQEARRALSGEHARPGTAEAVREHLETCGACRRYLADLRRRPAVLRALAPPIDAIRAGAILGHLREVVRSWRDRAG